VEINQINSEQKASMKIRVVTSIVMAVIMVPCLFLGNLFFLALMAFFLVFATYEILKATKKKYSVFVYLTSYAVVISLTFWTIGRNIIGSGGFSELTSTWYYMGLGELVSNPDLILRGGGISGLFISTSSAAIAIGLFFFMVVVDKNFTMRDATFLFTLLLFLSLALQSFMFLRYYPVTISNLADSITGEAAGTFWMKMEINSSLYEWFMSSFLFVYVVLGTILTDIGGYFVGILFGKNKMNERISPKKTWEGFFGGVIFSTIFSFGFAMTFAAVGLPILPIFTLSEWWKILIVSVAIGPISVLGDFSFSAIKREFGIKDFGKVFPGHGGVLDRFDSLSFSAVAATILITFFSIQWDFFA